MLWYHDLFVKNTLADWCAVVFHALPLDLSLAAYLTAVPMLLALTDQWVVSKRWRRFVAWGYYGLASLLIASAFVVNLGLYSFWKYPLDATPIFYFFSSPKDAFASVSLWFALGGVLAIVAVATVIFMGAWRCLPSVLPRAERLTGRIATTFCLVVLTGLLIIPIRGGVTVSSTNTGKVYFSGQQSLNHAAVNPLFSFMESMVHDEDFANQYRFMTGDAADRQFRQMVYTRTSPQTHQSLLRQDAVRPDVYIIVMESFSSKLMKTLGGLPNVAVNLDRLSKEGVLFTRFYANSFRTDRGLVAILSGFPAQPTMSIMKYPRKTAHLPSIAAAMKRAGYGANYYYGGDADFTNMRSYLVNSGYENIVSDVDFPVKERLSKWGVPDHLVFARLLNDLRSARQAKPMLRVLQTSSSHEPFDVPYHRLANKRLNAFAYTDDCIGKFIDQLKQTRRWQHSLVVLVPDHQGCYPEDISNTDFARYQIPLIMLGGAIERPCRIDRIGSQNDIAATLLAQLGIDHGEFTFSKDMLDTRAPAFAWFSVPGLLGMVTDEGGVIYDTKLEKTVNSYGQPDHPLHMGKAWLQKLYDIIDGL
nr:LTA synthase family protein [Prevotella illustrans]